MREIKIIGMGKSLSKQKIMFGDQTRYRCGEDETQLTLAVDATKKALESAGLQIDDIDCIVSACAVSIQPIPCAAVLISEQLRPSKPIPCMDINTTCTSFISAFDTMSYLIEAGRYNKVLIVSSDVSSMGVNPNQKESYELFSDAAAAFIIEKNKSGSSGILHSMQKTWVEGAHDTEIRGGLTNLHPKCYTEENKEEFMFDMKGKKVLLFAAKKLPELLNEFYNDCGMQMNDVDLIISHQASKALGMLMKKLEVRENKYIDNVQKYGNMVSASVPYVFCEAIEEGKVNNGDIIMLIGTAAGLTANILVLKY